MGQINSATVSNSQQQLLTYYSCESLGIPGGEIMYTAVPQAGAILSGCSRYRTAIKARKNQARQTHKARRGKCIQHLNCSFVLFGPILIVFCCIRAVMPTLGILIYHCYLAKFVGDF